MNFELFRTGSNEKSKKTYDSIYNKHLKRFADDEGVIPYSKNNDIVSYINTIDKSVNTKKGIYSLLSNMTSESVYKREWLKFKSCMETRVIEDNMSRPLDKPNKNQIIEFMNYQYKTFKYYGYAINFLYAYHNVTNMDFEFIRPRGKPTQANHIIVRKIDCVVVYDNQHIVVKSYKFLNACNALLGQNISHLTNDNVTEHTLRQMTFQ
tara:strand:- start:2061 stop:2684 length:624 start_codon:yes stop_codon:yes gene_type:complete